MSSNTFGTALTITTFGESHGPAIGVVIDGLESGFAIDMELLNRQMARRRPGGNPLGTSRQESDEVSILSGVFEGRTTGAPLAIMIANQNQRSGDYSDISRLFRPGHADFTWHKKFGIRDWRGGGRSSGRETAARLAAGAIAMQVLAAKGIDIKAYCIAIGTITTDRRDMAEITNNPVSCPDALAALAMQHEIEAAKAAKDSIGGIVECTVSGVPVGLGEPVFDKLEALLAHAIMSIGAVKGIEFGSGFAAAAMRGSQHNDQMDSHGFLSNHAGGINGGISNGDPIVFRLAVKPTASIAQAQRTVDIDGNERLVTVEGRHDSCICPRVVVVVEAMTALTMLDAWYRWYGRHGR
jgi:chorismate synthase